MSNMERKYLKCILNADSADFAVGQDEVVNSENVRFGSTDAGVIDTIESIGSTSLLSQIQPSISTVVIGSADDAANNRIVYFVADLFSTDDKILCYSIADGIVYTVLLSSQITGGFRFDKNSLIHSARVVNGMLYWVNGTTNEPRQIVIDAGIKLNHPSFVTSIVPYTAPVNFSEITIIKAPPPLAPIIVKNTDTGFANNFIANESFSFTFQYIYYSNETTVVGTYSNASRLNKVTDTFNRIIVTMNGLERIPQTVKIINLIVRIGITAFTIKTWDRSVSIEATEINNQNNGTAQLTFNFYNNVTGPALSSDLILKPFDSVPVYSWALEVAKNRLFLGNNVEGYDAPTETSLEFTLNTVTLSGSSISVNLKEIWLADVAGFTQQRYTGYYVYLDMVSPVGYYAITSTEQFCSGCVVYPPFPAAPTSITLGVLTYRGVDLPAVVTSVNTAYSGTLHGGQVFDSIYWATLTGILVSTYDVFKTRSQYKLGVVFYDYALRKCGVVTPPFSPGASDPTLVNIPARNFAMTTATNGINWTLDNVNPQSEIPTWAYYYCVVRTLNLRTRYFLQAIQQTSSTKYATRDADGNYVFTNNTFVSGAVGIGIDSTSLVQAGLGYVFTEGDVCYLTKEDNTAYTLSVIGQSGKYIIVNVPEGGIGDFTTFKIVYELYTPYVTSDQEPYYEMGKLSAIVNPGTDSRYYSAPTGTFIPDAYALTRNFDSITYFAETMSPNDRFFGRWDNDGGKVNFIVKTGQRVKRQNISFSNTFLPGTATNGLSTFEALNEDNLPLENGAIYKLITTSKVQDQGDVMLAICANETDSIYLGETQITDSTGATQFFAQSTGIIGTKNNLKGSFGTINAESVVEFRGNVYWVDMLNGKIIQYSPGGLFPISKYKMTRFWKLFSDQFLSMTQQEIEDLGNRPFVFTTVDPHHEELLISIPKLLSVPPKGKLPDYPFINYPFDIYDGQAKTIVFRINTEPNHWQGAYRFCAEGFITIENKLYSFKHGQLYLHNSLTSQCVFYGTQEKARIMCLSNSIPEAPKSYNNMTIQANMKPSFVYLYNDYPYPQSSDLISDDFRSLEGVFYSSIYRNKLIPTSTGYNINGLLTGEKMRAESLNIMLEFDVSQKQLEFKFIDIGFSISSGHTTVK